MRIDKIQGWAKSKGFDLKISVINNCVQFIVVHLKSGRSATSRYFENKPPKGYVDFFSDIFSEMQVLENKQEFDKRTGKVIFN